MTRMRRRRMRAAAEETSLRALTRLGEILSDREVSVADALKAASLTLDKIYRPDESEGDREYVIEVKD